MPFAGRSPNWGLGNDALVLVGLLTLGRFAIAAAAWDTGSGFGLMGASRDLTFAVFIEGALLLVFLLAALPAGGSTDLISMSHAASRGEVWNQPAHWCAGVAFVLVALAETGRQPVDNPDTHLELTMIHEGPLLEYAGRDLACLQWAASARLWLMLLLAAQLFAPTAGGFGVRAVILVATIGLLVVGLAVIETSLAKMRILRVPRLSRRRSEPVRRSGWPAGWQGAGYEHTVAVAASRPGPGGRLSRAAARPGSG